MHFLEDADFKIETVKGVGPYSYLIIAKLASTADRI
jgi:hypothetical protein